MKLPTRTKDLQWQKEGEAFILVDMEKQKNYTLDPMSFLVWTQCDGKTSLEKMADVFAVDSNRDIIKTTISEILNRLESSGLIKWI